MASVLSAITKPRRQMLAGSEAASHLDGIARAMSQKPAVRRGSDTPRLVHLVTRLYATGGHTRVLEDIIRLSPQYDHAILWTDRDANAVASIGTALRVDNRPAASGLIGRTLQQRFRNAEKQISLLAPDALISYAHPDDVVASMALAVAPAARRIHVHHADHSFSLLPRSPDICIATLFPTAGDGLRAAGIANIVFLNATCRDPYRSSQVRPLVDRAPTGEFTTVTCGGRGKFLDRDGRRYIDLLHTRFSARGGRHVHIGVLSAQKLSEIHQFCGSIGRTGGFVHIDFVSDLAATLADLRPHVYIGSYPMGGKKSSIEAMAAGCPIAAWSEEGFHAAAEIIYPEQMGWKDLDELHGALASFDDRSFRIHARQSRAYFEATYSEAKLSERIAALIAPE